ncbi:glycosyltransferase 87 family protein [Amycolatopsis magusensis]|uniref:Alpha-1,2-mannosyltransferase n=1 Tax=Amycolatopsis magusensis TaxID=882444 RepID=A0ABS4PST9_9PSEU|nr:glycosyltransferase 87 family protein [Amycolatopsis magusensis]MBP2182506.1 alpha-1,2-mannosyltransferase [Amycolatopsis magusensis]
MSSTEPRKPVVLKFFWVAVLLGLAGAWFTLWPLVESAGYWQIDLEVYRNGFTAWREDRDIYGVMPETQIGNPLPFIYPPFALLALLPFAALPWYTANTLLVLANFAAIAATVYVVGRHVWPAGGPRGAIMIAALVTPLSTYLEPVGDTFSFGQVNLLLMGLVAVDCLAPKAWWPRGIGVGLAAAVKLTPAAFVLYFLLRKDYRAALVAALTGVAATAVGFVVDFAGSVKFWTGGSDGLAEVSGSPFRTNQAIEAALARFGLSPADVTVWWIVLGLVLLGVTIVAMRRSDPAPALMANAALALLVSPTSWSHHWVWVVPALVVMLAYVVRRVAESSLTAIGWFTAALLTTVAFIVAPFHELPGYGDKELLWTTGQQLAGNIYLMLAVAFLLCLALPALTGLRHADALDRAANR